jgi:hypothetical protein
MVDEFSIAESIIVLKSCPFPSACAEDTKTGLLQSQELAQAAQLQAFHPYQYQVSLSIPVLNPVIKGCICLILILSPHLKWTQIAYS